MCCLSHPLTRLQTERQSLLSQSTMLGLGQSTLKRPITPPQEDSDSLSVLFLTQPQMLKPEHEEKELGDISDAALYAFSSMSTELVCLMAPLSDDCRQGLQKLLCQACCVGLRQKGK